MPWQATLLLTNLRLRSIVYLLCCLAVFSMAEKEKSDSPGYPWADKTTKEGYRNGKIKVTACEIEGLYVIEPTVFKDERGYFVETYNQNDFREAGLDMVFVQDNQSMSVRGVLRGLHYQKQFPQGKLVRVLRGEVFDVAVDLRADSPTFGKWFGVVLSAENKKQFFYSEEFCPRFSRAVGLCGICLQVHRLLPSER